MAVEGLQRAGLVGRRASRVDRRMVSVSLTDAGRRALTAKHRRLDTQRGELFMSLSEEDRVRGGTMLRTLAGVIEQL
jgi:DNA-binding MarR family transcriptional regulator